MYCGSWVMNKKKGNGKLIYKNGTIEEGEWINDALIVDDEFIYPNGDIYTGKHADGYKHGYGIMQYFKTGDVYEGNWVSN